MIIEPKHNFFIDRFFKNYSLRRINKVFEKVEVNGSFKNQNKPLFVISNHTSWWDGFWIMYLNLKYFHRKFHFMMLEEQLKKYWFFNYCGGYSVNKKSKTIIETLKYTLKLLKDKNNMVLIFPQGGIQSSYQKDITFEKGIEWIVKRAPNIQIIQVANLVDYFSKQKPSLYIYLKEVNLNSNYTLEELYNQFYSNSIEKQIKKDS